MRLSVCSLSWTITFRIMVRQDALSVLIAGLEEDVEDEDVAVEVLELRFPVDEVVLG